MGRSVCASHGHCFDGLASAALMTQLLRHTTDSKEVRYVTCGYGGHPPVVEFDGEQNALLDYRYMPDDRLTFYFDHHPTAFADPASEAHFSAQMQQLPSQFAYDPTSVSCAEIIAKHLVSAGVDISPHHDLIRAAHQVDGARFDSVAAATDLADPVLQLVSVVTHFGDAAFYSRTIPILLSEGVAALSQDKKISQRFRQLKPAFEKYNKAVLSHGTQTGRVAYIQLEQETLHVVTKFQQYAQFPSALFSVILARAADGFRISVGFNPWHGAACDRDIGALCSNYGGGGHRVVGGIALPLDQGQRAKEIATEIVSVLLD